MANELATRQDTATWDLVAGQGIGEALKVCGVLAKSGMLPKHLDDGAKVLALVLRGREMGMGPLEACSAMHYVEGRVVLDASAQLAQAHRSGVRTRWTETTDQRAIVVLSRGGEEYTSTYTIAMAQRAGLAGRKTWQAHPEAMLRARAITSGIRAFCPEVLGGAVYTADEAQDAEPVTVHRKAAIVVEPEPVARPSWSPDDRAEFAEALGKMLPMDVSIVHVEDFAQHVGMPAPEGMTPEQRAKFIARLATPDGLAKLVAFAKEHP